MFSLSVSILTEGVKQSGAEYDEDLDLTENNIIEKCAVI